LTELNPQEQKDLVKQAIKEWMDEKLRDFGWWWFKTIGVAGLTLLLFYYIQVRGYKFP
jgi:hypothetical protein